MWLRRAVLVLVVVCAIAASQAYGVHGKGHKKCVYCPQCHACCDLTIEQEKETRHCWKIECKEICIPCVVFPWQKRPACPGHTYCGGTCVVHNGARVITVRVPVKEEYECPTCRYTWSLRKPAAPDSWDSSSTGASSSNGNGSGGAGASGDASGSTGASNGADGQGPSEQPMPESVPVSPFQDDPIDPAAGCAQLRRAGASRTIESARVQRLRRIRELIQATHFSDQAADRPTPAAPSRQVEPVGYDGR